jgi:hypothetical protein
MHGCQEKVSGWKIYATEGEAGVRRLELRREKKRRQVIATVLRVFSEAGWCCGGCFLERGVFVVSPRAGMLSRSGRWMGMTAAGWGPCFTVAGGERTKAGMGGTGGGGDARVGLGGGER